MLHRRFYSPFEDEAEVIKPKPLADPLVKPEVELDERGPAHFHIKKVVPQKRSDHGPLGFLSRLKIDDLILIGLLLLLIFEETEEERDLSLILGIGFLLITEFLD